MNSLARTILVVFLILLLIGMLPTWGYVSAWGVGWYPSGGLGLVLVIVLILLLLGKI